GFFLRQDHNPACPVGKPLEHGPRRPSHPYRQSPTEIRYIALKVSAELPGLTMATWSTTTQARGRCRAVARPGSGNGRLSVRGAPPPSRALRVSFGNGLRPPLTAGLRIPSGPQPRA